MVLRPQPTERVTDCGVAKSPPPVAAHPMSDIACRVHVPPPVAGAQDYNTIESVHWNTGLFGCLSSLPTFLLSCVCPCVVAGQLGEHIGTPRSARDATRPPANGSSTG